MQVLRAIPLVTVMLLAGAARAGDPAVDFNRDIRPLLSDRCSQCHGPDAGKRKADLRLDQETGIASVVEKGKPEQSELIRRITASDPKKRMPPASIGRPLSEAQVNTIRRWVAQGAKWQSHWAFQAPQRPAIPEIRNPKSEIRNPIDAFVLDRLHREGLTLSPETDRATLIRRVSLDLTGLPPTPHEVDDFQQDRSPHAYEKVVERLLRSPRYGERMAVPWLNAARYADTSGYQTDGERIMWRWRDWVIDALNANMPFDQFTIEQLAGDLLPNATLEQRIATGFNRNHRGNSEGGIIPEEYAVEYVADRVETMATVWLGLTLGCTRCHDHKYDPFRQKEFYQLFAYFNNVPEHGRAIKLGNSPPYVISPTRKQQEELADLNRRLAVAEKRFAELEPKIHAEQAAWEKSPAAIKPQPWEWRRDLRAHFSFDESDNPGRIGRARAFDGQRYFDAGDVGDFGFFDKFTLAAWINPTNVNSGAVMSRMPETPQAEGFALVLVDGKLRLHLTKRWLDDALRVETKRVLQPNEWHHVAVTYDGSRLASGVRIYVDGKAEPLQVLLDELNQTFANKEPFRIGSGGGPGSRFHGSIDDVRIFGDALTPDEAAWLAVVETPTEIVAIPPNRRSPAQAGKLHAYFLDTQAPHELRSAYQALNRLRDQRLRLLESFPSTMVMEEMPTPRDAFVLIRGVYDKRGEKVAPGLPAVLPSLPNGMANNRLALARWLVDPANPLTARVAVNRLWAMLFGTGLVKTVDDFGTQGEYPSHPELLDWLATEYVRIGWDTKAMLRLIVTSATYRQSSLVRKDSVIRDPDNRLLSRFPRLRLPAETIRDQALFASGLLVEELGGPSVKPYQPVGLGKDLGADPYVQDSGRALYRRSLYTFWKRTVQPPNMTTFDAGGRETCIVRESRTNTPLQALTLLNDVTFVEASRKLAERALRDGGSSAEERLSYMCRLALARKPTAIEIRVLTAGLEGRLSHYRNDRGSAKRLLANGSAPVSSAFDVAELAAYAATASVILNLDETITRE